MIISVNWLKKYTDIDVSIDELATLIGSRLVEIEEVIDLGAKYKDVVVAKVIDCQKLEDSDHLNVTKLDDGGVIQGVERDENGLVQVVCGAPNVRAGMLIAWLPPGSIVPETYSTKEPFLLGARKLRGVMSNGMIASARELALFDEHDGILEVDKDCAPGSKFVEVYELDDHLLDIENKSLTHRPDAFGIIGFAREVAAIQGKAFQTPELLRTVTPFFELLQSTIEAPRITIDDEQLSDRYQAIILSGADGAAQSPLEMQTYLARVGVRPINAVVDVTNYLMMVTGQPLHAFDYDKVLAVSGGDAHIHVRAGRDDEQLELLDGRTVTLSSEDIVIAAGETAIGLAGAMGGANTEIDSSTKTIILESATFNLFNLRATQMRHGIFSEAITRFTKGQPAELTAPVLAWAVELLSKHAGAKPVAQVAESYPGRRNTEPIVVSIERINHILGSKFTAADAVEILQNVEITVATDDQQTLAVMAPFWRSDIHIPEDVIEEIGRLSGFDSIEPTLPRRDFAAVRPSDFDTFRTRVRKSLVRSGANEVLTYSFVHGDILKKAGQQPQDSYRITNSISPDLQYYRQSIAPSLLGLIHSNIKKGYNQFALFELNKTHSKTAGVNDENVPIETSMICLVLARKSPDSNGAPYYMAKRLLDALLASLSVKLSMRPFASEPTDAYAAPFEWRRSAQLVDSTTGMVVGIVGEYKASVVRNFKLPAYCAGFELIADQLFTLVQESSSYTPLSRYPSIDRDICFQVESELLYADVIDATNEALRDIDIASNVTPLDIYQADDATTKNITIRIQLTAFDRTLTSEDAAGILAGVTHSVTTKTQAQVI